MEPIRSEEEWEEGLDKVEVNLGELLVESNRRVLPE